MKPQCGFKCIHTQKHPEQLASLASVCVYMSWRFYDVALPPVNLLYLFCQAIGNHTH